MSDNDQPVPKTPDSDLPPSPFTELMVGATHLFEFFSTLMEAGFNERQALYLVGQALRPNPPEGTTP
jgi:hypothetical protein